MRAAIMQPYFLPYIGYFQLIAAVDVFIVYDNIKYTKKGWINRNRFLMNGGPSDFVIPIKKESDYLDVRDRHLAADYDGTNLLNRFRQAYQKAPFAREVFPFLEVILCFPDRNLFGFIHHSLVQLCRYLDIETRIIVSSSIDVDHTLKSQDKVMAICRQVGASTYINAIGGRELYSTAAFLDNGIDLRFLQSRPIHYHQLDQPFVPWLSILDLLMFNSRTGSTEFLAQYDLVGAE